MRTTLTIDDDLMLRLKEEANRKRQPFRDVVNAALRRAFEAPRKKPHGRVTKTYSSKLRPGFDPAGFNKLVDELEDDALARTLAPRR
jgi:hypothetical protein